MNELTRHTASGVPRVILTSYWAKPIPIRFYDWEATLEDYEAGDAIGFGGTEADAIADLKEQLEEREPLSDEPVTGGGK